ncbi:hypothetical protein [Nocardia carnea]|uniref:hypothetical protein n=1 Tax=Nocardia carnea TaxID=37328 RepID=UPI0024575C6E|nr:hypothetical protein [Nocardia carnea]
MRREPQDRGTVRPDAPRIEQALIGLRVVAEQNARHHGKPFDSALEQSGSGSADAGQVRAFAR